MITDTSSGDKAKTSLQTLLISKLHPSSRLTRVVYLLGLHPPPPRFFRDPEGAQLIARKDSNIFRTSRSHRLRRYLAWDILYQHSWYSTPQVCIEEK